MAESTHLTLETYKGAGMFQTGWAEPHLATVEYIVGVQLDDQPALSAHDYTRTGVEQSELAELDGPAAANFYRLFSAFRAAPNSQFIDCHSAAAFCAGLAAELR